MDLKILDYLAERMYKFDANPELLDWYFSAYQFYALLVFDEFDDVPSEGNND